MAFDPELAERIRKTVGSKKKFSEKKMFGGLAFMLGDKMCFGVEDAVRKRAKKRGNAGAMGQVKRGNILSREVATDKGMSRV